MTLGGELAPFLVVTGQLPTCLQLHESCPEDGVSATDVHYVDCAAARLLSARRGAVGCTQSDRGQPTLFAEVGAHFAVLRL